jgi:hypothetical protein
MLFLQSGMVTISAAWNCVIVEPIKKLFATHPRTHLVFTSIYKTVLIMTKNHSSIALIMIILAFSASCKKASTGPAGPAGPVGPIGPAGTSKGAISGHISLYDQYGTRIFTGLNSVLPGLKGGGALAGVDSTGYFAFGGLATSTYTILASCPGFGATMAFNIPVVSDTFYKDIKLSQKPAFNISTFTAFHNAGSLFDSLVLGYEADSRPRACIVFVGKNTNVSNQPANYLLYYTKILNTWSTKVNIQVPATDLNGAGIYYGEQVFYAAYSYVINDASAYEDPATGRNVYNAIGSAIIDSAKCP